MVCVRGPGIDSFYQQQPSDVLDVPSLGIQGASWFLGVSEWLFGGFLFLGFWDKRLGMLGALGCCVTFIMTVTIIPFMPDGWAASAGGFPAMVGNVAFLMKDVVSFCRIILFAEAGCNESGTCGGFGRGILRHL
jgi:uncharacterized membrane protein YkgB